jgi:hypothetical protein
MPRTGGNEHERSRFGLMNGISDFDPEHAVERIDHLVLDMNV